MDTAETLTQADERKTYEVGFLLTPSLSEESLGVELARIRDEIEKAKGAIVGEGYPALRPLSYPIAYRVGGVKQQLQQAYFGYIKFTLVPEEVLTVKAGLEKVETLVRFLIMIAGKENPAPIRRVPQMAARAGAPVDAAEKRSLTEADEAEIMNGIEELLTEEKVT